MHCRYGPEGGGAGWDAGAEDLKLGVQGRAAGPSHAEAPSGVVKNGSARDLAGQQKAGTHATERRGRQKREQRRCTPGGVTGLGGGSGCAAGARAADRQVRG